MSAAAVWLVVLLSGLIAWLTKLAGYWVPARWLQGARVTAVMRYLPVALLASLVAVQTFANGAAVTLDARAAALAVAALALFLRAPFLAVVILAAAVAAALRALGWAA